MIISFLAVRWRQWIIIIPVVKKKVRNFEVLLWALCVLKERMIFMFSEGERCREMIAVSRDCLKFCTFFAISRVYMDVSVSMAVIQCVYTDGTHIVGFFYSFIMYVSLMFVFGCSLLYFILMAGGFSFSC